MSQKTIRRARGIMACDHENGDAEIYMCYYRLRPNALLLRNDGHATFTDVAKASGTDGDGDLGAWGTRLVRLGAILITMAGWMSSPVALV